MEVPFYEVEKTVNKQVCGGSRGRGNTIVSEILELRFLLGIQEIMSSRELDIQVWSSDQQSAS